MRFLLYRINGERRIGELSLLPQCIMEILLLKVGAQPHHQNGISQPQGDLFQRLVDQA